MEKCIAHSMHKRKDRKTHAGNDSQSSSATGRKRAKYTCGVEVHRKRRKTTMKSKRETVANGKAFKNLGSTAEDMKSKYDLYVVLRLHKLNSKMKLGYIKRINRRREKESLINVNGHTY